MRYSLSLLRYNHSTIVSLLEQSDQAYSEAYDFQPTYQVTGKDPCAFYLFI